MTNENRDTQSPQEMPKLEEMSDTYHHLPLEEQVPALRNDLEAARREVSQNLDLARRAQAELINYRRRNEDERVTLEKYSNSRLIAKLLPVVDELDLAIAQAGEHTTNAPWLEGVRLIQRKLSTLFDSEGVAKIDATGVMFNPLEHEALDTEGTSEHPPGYVSRVVRGGYRLHDRVILPARVIVARKPDDTPEANDSLNIEESEYD